MSDLFNALGNAILKPLTDIAEQVTGAVFQAVTFPFQIVQGAVQSFEEAADRAADDAAVRDARAHLHDYLNNLHPEVLKLAQRIEDAASHYIAEAPRLRSLADDLENSGSGTADIRGTLKTFRNSFGSALEGADELVQRTRDSREVLLSDLKRMSVRQKQSVANAAVKFRPVVEQIGKTVDLIEAWRDQALVLDSQLQNVLAKMKTLDAARTAFLLRAHLDATEKVVKDLHTQADATE